MHNPMEGEEQSESDDDDDEQRQDEPENDGNDGMGEGSQEDMIQDGEEPRERHPDDGTSLFFLLSS